MPGSRSASGILSEPPQARASTEDRDTVSAPVGHVGKAVARGHRHVRRQVSRIAARHSPGPASGGGHAAPHRETTVGVFGHLDERRVQLGDNTRPRRAGKPDQLPRTGARRQPRHGQQRQHARRGQAVRPDLIGAKVDRAQQAADIRDHHVHVRGVLPPAPRARSAVGHQVGTPPQRPIRFQREHAHAPAPVIRAEQAPLVGAHRQVAGLGAAARHAAEHLEQVPVATAAIADTNRGDGPAGQFTDRVHDRKPRMPGEPRRRRQRHLPRGRERPGPQVQPERAHPGTRAARVLGVGTHAHQAAARFGAIWSRGSGHGASSEPSGWRTLAAHRSNRWVSGGYFAASRSSSSIPQPGSSDGVRWPSTMTGVPGKTSAAASVN